MVNSNIKLFFRRLWIDIKHFSVKKFVTKIYYRLLYKIDTSEDGSMLPVLGETKRGYSVKTKGAYTDIRIKSGEIFRIIPDINSYGFKLELLSKEGNIKARTTVTDDYLRKIIDKDTEASQ